MKYAIREGRIVVKSSLNEETMAMKFRSLAFIQAPKTIGNFIYILRVVAAFQRVSFLYQVKNQFALKVLSSKFRRQTETLCLVVSYILSTHTACTVPCDRFLFITMLTCIMHTHMHTCFVLWYFEEVIKV